MMPPAKSDPSLKKSIRISVIPFTFALGLASTGLMVPSILTIHEDLTYHWATPSREDCQAERFDVVMFAIRSEFASSRST